MHSTESREIIERFQELFKHTYRNDIGELAQKYPDEQQSLYVDWEEINRFDSDIAEDIIAQPEQMISFAERALRTYELPVDVDLGSARVRIENLPETTRLAELKSDAIENLIAVYGSVRKTGSTRSVPREAAWECQRCGTLTRMSISMATTDPDSPYECQGCERQGPFQLNDEQTKYEDLQPFVVEQRNPQNITETDSESIVVHARNEIAGSVSPGEFVTVPGILKRTTNDPELDATIFDKRIEAQSISENNPYGHISISDDNKREIIELSGDSEIYEKLIQSFAPTISGKEQVKLSLLLQLFGGVPKSLPDETRIRGDSHILLVGDPGTAKSRLLAYSAFLSPRSVEVSGESSEAGLTATASRSSGPGNPWEITGGALVLADQGLITIDNLDTLRQEAKTSISNVIEEQVVKVSKATVTDHLKARTSVLAAAQPRYGRVDQYEPIPKQIDLNAKLVSQFDLIHLFTDVPDGESDRETADDILQTNYAGELLKHREQVPTSNISEEEVEAALDGLDPEVRPDLLQEYIAYAKRNCFPRMTEEAKNEIQEFYVDLRSKGASEDAPVPVSARKLEALVRLAEASARIRLSDTIDEQDAERVISLVRDSLESIGVNAGLEADMVGTDSSKAPNQSDEMVEKIIRELEAEYEDGAPIDEVFIRAKKMGMEQDTIEHEIKKLRRQGDIYEPTTDHLRTI